MTACLVPDPATEEPHGAVLGDGTTCCTACAARLAHALGDVPTLLADLEVTLSRQDQLGDPGRSLDGTLMWKASVPDAVWALGNTLTVWARDLADRHRLVIRDTVTITRPIRGSAAELDPDSRRAGARGPRCDETGLHPDACAHCRRLGHLEPLPDDAVPARARPARPGPVLGQRPPSALDSVRIAALWLYVHLDVLRRDVEAHQAVDEITSAIEQAGAACSAPPLRLYVGPCGALRTVDDEAGGTRRERCGEDLYARPDFQAVRCQRCETLHSDMAARWDRALWRIRLYPATAAVISRHVGELYGVKVDRKLINQWHARRRIKAVDHDAEGSPRFRIGRVLDLARRQGSDPAKVNAG